MDSPHTFYADSDISLFIRADGLGGKTLSWSLKSAGGTIAAGEQQIPENGAAEIKIHSPKLNPCVIADAELTCLAGELEIHKSISFYHPDIFANQKTVYSKLKIGIFQPETDAPSALKLFEKHGIEVVKLSSVSDYAGKLLIVSGVNFSENPGLFESLIKKTDEGTRVLVIAPVSGRVSLGGKPISRILFAGTDIIPEFNKKYDSESWNGKRIAGTCFKTVPLDDGIAIEFTAEPGAFSYCEIRSSSPEGRLIICGFDMIGLAAESPTAAYLFKELLGQVIEKP